MNGNALRGALIASYDRLIVRLARRLGSTELAFEVLHETFLRLEQRRDLGDVKNPEAYLLRIALNLAVDRRRADRKHRAGVGSDGLPLIADQAPSPAKVAEDRSLIECLKRAIAELPPRRREVLLAARVEGKTNRELAERYGVTVRTIELELKSAIEHCAQRVLREDS